MILIDYSTKVMGDLNGNGNIDLADDILSDRVLDFRIALAAVF